jgi:hypothetical protein
MRSAVCALVLLMSASPLFAHHGKNGVYNEKEAFILKGTVKEFRWRNPHSFLYVDAKDATGKPVTYLLEMGAPNGMSLAGYTRQSFKPGDQVVMETYQSFTNPLDLYFRYSHKVAINGKEVVALKVEE